LLRLHVLRSRSRIVLSGHGRIRVLGPWRLSFVPHRAFYENVMPFCRVVSNYWRPSGLR
jgi:hypothetical protein